MSNLAEPTLVRSEAALEPCRNCGGLPGPSYCGACGQQRYQGRFTLARVTEHVWAEVTSLDRGLIHTFLVLCYRPGAAIREYLNGKTVSYTNPGKYLVFVVAITTLVVIQAGQFETLETGVTQTATRLLPLIEAGNKYLNLLIVFGVPFATLWSYLLFRRAGFNWAEHLIFNLYTYSQQSILYTIFALLLLPIEPFSSQVVGAATMVVYYVWAARQFFDGKTGMIGVRALLAIGLSVLSYTVVLAGISAGYLLLSR